jgi:hypothetical protein
MQDASLNKTNRLRVINPSQELDFILDRPRPKNMREKEEEGHTIDNMVSGHPSHADTRAKPPQLPSIMSEP